MKLESKRQATMSINRLPGIVSCLSFTRHVQKSILCRPSSATEIWRKNEEVGRGESVIGSLFRLLWLLRHY